MSSITTHSSSHWLVEPIREWCWKGAGGAVGRLIHQILKKRDVLVVFLKLYIKLQKIYINILKPNISGVGCNTPSKGLHMFYPKSFEPGNVHTAAQG